MSPLIRRLRRGTFNGLAFEQLLLLIYITGKNFKTNVILLLNERCVFGGRKNVPPRSAGRDMVMRVPAVGCTALETELEAGFEAGEVQLEGGGAGGVGIVVGGEAGEAVAEEDAVGIVGEAGGKAEVELVVVLILRVFDFHFALCRMGDIFVGYLVAVPASGGVGSEVPVEAFAEQTTGNEADTLEELEGDLIDVVVFVVNTGGGKGEEVVETMATLGVEGVAGVAVFETQADAVGFGEGAHDADTDTRDGGPRTDFVFLRGEADHIAELDIEVAAPFGTVAERVDIGPVAFLPLLAEHGRVAEVVELGRLHLVGEFGAVAGDGEALVLLVGEAETGGIAVEPDVEGAAVELFLVEGDVGGGVHVVNLDLTIGVEGALLVLHIAEEGTADFGGKYGVEEMKLDHIVFLDKAEGGAGNGVLPLVAEIGGLRHTVAEGIVEIGVEVGGLLNLVEELHGGETGAGLQGASGKTGHEGAGERGAIDLTIFIVSAGLSDKSMAEGADIGFQRAGGAGAKGAERDVAVALEVGFDTAHAEDAVGIGGGDDGFPG